MKLLILFLVILDFSSGFVLMHRQLKTPDHNVGSTKDNQDHDKDIGNGMLWLDGFIWIPMLAIGDTESKPESQQNFEHKPRDLDWTLSMAPRPLRLQ